MSNTPINVSLGQIVVSRDPQDILVAYGLGSCVAIGCWDPKQGIGGMLHAVLPERTNGADPLSGKFVDSGIEGLLYQLERCGADRRRLVTWMAGGANMLVNAALGQSFEIGIRNVNAAQQTLQRLNLPLKAKQVGGNSGRTVRLYISDGHATIRTVGGKEEVLV
jgi:chemotaxis protein CheD